jgi:hypothetical protein
MYIPSLQITWRTEMKEDAVELTPEEFEECRRRAKEHTIAGGAIGVATAASIALLGVSCPLCVVAAPALLGSGAWNARKKRKAEAAQRINLPLRLRTAIAE